MADARFVRWAKYEGVHFVEEDGQGGYSVYLHDERGSYPFAVCGDGNDAAAIAATFNRMRELRAEVDALTAERDRLREALVVADELVSRAHDIVWASYPEWEGEAGRREPLNAALWRLHEHLRAAAPSAEQQEDER